jgi:hypothetical protein
MTKSSAIRLVTSMWSLPMRLVALARKYEANVLKVSFQLSGERRLFEDRSNPGSKFSSIGPKVGTATAAACLSAGKPLCVLRSAANDKE